MTGDEIPVLCPLSPGPSWIGRAILVVAVGLICWACIEFITGCVVAERVSREVPGGEDVVDALNKRAKVVEASGHHFYSAIVASLSATAVSIAVVFESVIRARVSWLVLAALMVIAVLTGMVFVASAVMLSPF